MKVNVLFLSINYLIGSPCCPRLYSEESETTARRGEAGAGVYIWNAYEVGFCLSTLEAAEAAAIINFKRVLTDFDCISPNRPLGLN